MSLNFVFYHTIVPASRHTQSFVSCPMPMIEYILSVDKLPDVFAQQIESAPPKGKLNLSNTEQLRLHFKLKRDRQALHTQDPRWPLGPHATLNVPPSHQATITVSLKCRLRAEHAWLSTMLPLTHLSLRSPCPPNCMRANLSTSVPPPFAGGCQFVFRTNLLKPSTCHHRGHSRSQPIAWGH